MPTRYWWLVVLALIMVACGPQMPATSQTSPVSVQPAVRSALAEESTNANGEYVLGSPNAPVTLIDYSDFL